MRIGGGSRCSPRGATRLAPLRVVKEINGKPMDVSPGGAAARESAFIQSYRAELAHFELNRCWAQVVCEHEGARLALRSHGRRIEVGRHLCDEQRLEMARGLARELRRT